VRIRLANAPVSWGVDYADDPANPPWPTVLDGIAAAGYAHCELGPVGYLPEEPAALTAELQARGLRVTGSFIFDHMHDPAQRDRVLAVARRACRFVAAADGTHFVLVNHLVPERTAVAGVSAAGRRLRGAAFDEQVAGLRAVAAVAREAGLRPVLHPHAGTFVEYRDEIDAVLAAIPAAELGLCIDTGHSAYAGVDPVALYEDYRDRCDYLHFKDVDAEVHARVVAERIDFLSAVTSGVFTPLGRGVVDFPSLQEALVRHGFDGAATVEQDVDPAVGPDPLGDAIRSLEYLRRVGLATEEVHA
jgi:inosose dehydratase